jgi:hypothetical protein
VASEIGFSAACALSRDAHRWLRLTCDQGVSIMFLCSFFMTVLAGSDVLRDATLVAIADRGQAPAL